jgi:hypothetical protein
MKGKKMGSKKRTMRGRKQRGGQAPVNDSSMLSPSSSSLAQGIDYKQIHMGQHGGAAPVESIGATLPQELQGPAAITSTMNSFRDIQGMSDQTGGARRRGRGTKRSKRSLKLYGGNYKMYGGVGCKMYGGKRRKGTKRAFKLYGGGANANPAAASSPGLILPSSVTQGGMNPEWDLAKDPQAFAPKMGGGNLKMYGGKRRGGTKRRKAKKWFGLF